MNARVFISAFIRKVRVFIRKVRVFIRKVRVFIRKVRAFIARSPHARSLQGPLENASLKAAAGQRMGVR